MSLIRKTGQSANPFGELVSSLNRHITETGLGQSQKDLAGVLVAGLESANLDQLQTIRTTGASLLADAKRLYAAAVGNEAAASITEASWEAGAMVLLAAGDLRSYAERANKVEVSNEGANVVYSNSFGGFDYQLKPAVEAYDDRELRQYLPYSFLLNVQASRQSAAAELLFKTVVIDPSQGGLDLTVRRPTLFNEVRHEITGRAMDFHRRNLISAIVDPTIMANDSTRAYPVFVTGNTENNSHFVPTATMATRTATIEGQSFDTSALKFNMQHDLLGLSTTPNVIGTQDSTDALDHDLALDAIYVSFDADGAGAGAAKVVKFPVRQLFSASFQKSPEGLERSMVLNFASSDLIVDSNTQAVDGALGWLAAGEVVRLRVSAGGNADLQVGNIEVTAGTLAVANVFLNGVDVTGTAAATTILAKLGTMALQGFDPFAHRSNLNRRHLGIKADALTLTERVVIPMGAPITNHTPITSANEQIALQDMINIARIRNDNNAFTKLNDYANQLAAAYAAPQIPGVPAAVEGIGRHLVEGIYFGEANFDVQAEINSIRSQDRAEDLAAVVVNKLRDLVYTGLTKTAYQSALDLMTGGGVSPTVAIVTDPTIARYLITPGDSRLMSIGLPWKLEVTPNVTIRDKIYATLVLPGIAEPHPLSFGFFAYMPELVATAVVTRNNQVSREPMVQPRTRHVVTLPFLVRINVSNISAAATDKTSIDFNAI